MCKEIWFKPEYSREVSEETLKNYNQQITFPYSKGRISPKGIEVRIHRSEQGSMFKVNT